MKKIIKTVIFTIFVLSVITLTNKVEASYQSVYKSDASTYLRTDARTWITNIRNMEASGQVMGLKETKDGTTFLPSESNNIDVHMQKNTEYGSMILLAASPEYGKQGSGTARYIINGTGLQTTTGNVYGVYMNDIGYGYCEWTAAYIRNLGGNSYNTGANGRYLNRYADVNTRLAGDALLNWHRNSTIYTSLDFIIIRGESGQGAFYTNYGGYGSGYYSRAVIVNGKNF